MENPVEVGGVMLETLKLVDWTFSGTAEAVIGAALVVAIVVSALV